MKENILYRLRHFFLVFIPFWLIGFILVLATSKRELFLEINAVHSVFFDHFFKWETWLGNWVVFVITVFVLFLKNKGWGILGLIVFAISALLPQVFKKLIFADVVRPVKFYEGSSVLHLVEGVPHHMYHSFPSGHSTSIVALCMMLSYLIGEGKWSVLLAIIALLTMYSRVYLAQHFPVDVLAGATLGIIAGWVGIAIYNKWIVFNQRFKNGLIKKR